MPQHITPAYQSDDDSNPMTGPQDLLRSTRDLRVDITTTSLETRQYIIDLEEQIQALTKENNDEKKKKRGGNGKFTALGKQFSLTVSLWLHDQYNAFTVKEDPKYKPSIRYQNHDMVMQGQIRDLKVFVPESLHANFSDKKFQKMFIVGMQEQRGVAISRIRDGLSKIFKGLNVNIDNPEERRKLNGWSQKEDGSGSYHWPAPISYENFDYNKDYPGRARLFHNMAIVRAYLLLFYGEAGLNEFKTVKTGTYGGRNPIGIMWRLREATPAMLAVVTTLLRCALTEDKCFNANEKAGSCVSYHDFFDNYMAFCVKRSKQKELGSTLEWVNHLLYPQYQQVTANGDSDMEETRNVLGEPSSDYEDVENSREMREMNEDEDDQSHAQQTDMFAASESDGESQDTGRVSRPRPRMISRHSNETISSATPQTSVTLRASATSTTPPASITLPAFTISQASTAPQAPSAPQDSIVPQPSVAPQASRAAGPLAITVYGAMDKDAPQTHGRQKRHSDTVDTENCTRRLRSRVNAGAIADKDTSRDVRKGSGRKGKNKQKS